MFINKPFKPIDMQYYALCAFKPEKPKKQMQRYGGVKTPEIDIDTVTDT